MIRQMAFAIAEAQLKLDENSIEVAQMMGGLKTIYNDDGEVSFTDSRVFFGKEKITLGVGLDLFNSSNNAGYKSELMKTLTNYCDRKMLLTEYTESGYYSKVANFAALNMSHVNPNTFYIVKASNVDTLTENDLIYRFIGFDDSSGTTKAVHEQVSFIEFLQLKLKNGAQVANSIFIPSRVSMLELGFAPTFYQFVDTIIEVKIAIKYTAESSSTTNVQTNNRQVIRSGSVGLGGSVLGGGIKARIGATSESSRTVVTSQVNATYSQKYSYSAEGSSLLRTKLVPIPPPAMLEERVRQIMQNYDEERAIAPAE